MKSFKGKPAIVMVPAYDSIGRKDSSGAFKPEAQRLIKHLDLNATLRLFDNNRAPADRRKEVSLAFQRVQSAELCAFLCHGWKDGIQAGFNMQTVQTLAADIALACTSTATVALYCCDTASNAKDSDDKRGGPGGLGGFASELYQALNKRGFTGQLWAHTTAGHTTQNPYVRIWSCDESVPLAHWAVEPESDEFAPWRRLLATTTLRYSMLTCETLDELNAEIARLSPLAG